jgi:hypothetical protein
MENKMISTSMTSFIDFALKAGKPKLTAVRRVVEQYRNGYSPATDFYRELRTAIRELHAQSLPVQRLKSLAVPGDPKKAKHYAAITDGYIRFLRRKRIASLPLPPAVDWSNDDLLVKVNPEVALEIQGVPHLIKLYLKDEKLRRPAADLANELFRGALADGPYGGWTVGVLDVRQAKFFGMPIEDLGLDALLDGEARSFAAMYRALDR